MRDKVLDRIQNVRDWLDQAENDYQNDQTWQGELNLNLAQAELKKAWEESQNLHDEDKVIPLPSASDVTIGGTASMQARTRMENQRRFSALGRHRFGLVAAVVLLIFVSMTPLLNYGFLDQFRQVADLEPDLQEGTRPEMVALGQAQYNNYVSNKDEGQAQVQTQVSTQQVRRGTPINHRAYNQEALRFNVQKDPLILTPEKGVTVETIQIPQPKIELASQVALESTNIQVVGKSKTFTTANHVVYSSKVPAKEVSQQQYDLDTLIDLAKETLYTH